MKQKRIYKVMEITYGPDSMAINQASLIYLREYCITVAQSSDRAYDTAKQRLSGFLNALNVYETQTIYSTALRTDHKTVVHVATFEGDTIITVLAEREATNE